MAWSVLPVKPQGEHSSFGVIQWSVHWGISNCVTSEFRAQIFSSSTFHVLPVILVVEVWWIYPQDQSSCSLKWLPWTITITQGNNYFGPVDISACLKIKWNCALHELPSACQALMFSFVVTVVDSEWSWTQTTITDRGCQQTRIGWCKYTTIWI